MLRAQGSSAEGPVVDYSTFTSSLVLGDKTGYPGGCWEAGVTGHRCAKLPPRPHPSCHARFPRHHVPSASRPTTLKVAGAAGLPGGR